MEATPFRQAEKNVDLTTDGAYDELIDPLRQALGARQRYYKVAVGSLGRAGQVLVSITGSSGRLPLIVSPQDVEPGDVVRVVTDTLDKYGM